MRSTSSKPFNDQELLERIQKAIEGDLGRAAAIASDAEACALLATLSPRGARGASTCSVLGKANKEVADQSGLSTRTVEGHRARLMEKSPASLPSWCV